MVERIERRHRHQHTGLLGCGQCPRDQQQHQPHLADTGVRQYRLALTLAYPDQCATDGGQCTGAHQQITPAHQADVAQWQGKQPAQQARLDHGATEHRTGRRRRHRVRQGQPHVQQRQPGLDTETRQQQPSDQVNPVGTGNGGGEVRQPVAVGACHCQHQPRQQHELTEHRHDQVDPPGPQRRCRPLVHHQPVAGEGHQREKRVKTGGVPGQGQTDIAAQGQAPEDDKASLMGTLQVTDGKQPGAAPEHCREGEEDTAQVVQQPHTVHQQPGQRPLPVPAVAQGQHQGRQRQQRQPQPQPAAGNRRQQQPEQGQAHPRHDQ